MINQNEESLWGLGMPNGTKQRLDRLKGKVENDLGIKVKSRAALIRLILLEGIADLERNCASIRGALILKYRKGKET